MPIDSRRSYELWGPWTGPYLKPDTRRAWLKYRTLLRFIAIAIVAALAGYAALCWLNAAPVSETPTRICGFNDGRCQ
jgi:hypothetical protein